MADLKNLKKQQTYVFRKNKAYVPEGPPRYQGRRHSQGYGTQAVTAVAGITASRRGATAALVADKGSSHLFITEKF